MTREEFLIKLMSLHGLPYIYGGQDMNGVDCSGLVQIALSWLKVNPPNDLTAQGLYNYFVQPTKGRALTFEARNLGDISFYGKSDDNISHCGLALNNELMLEAAGGTPEIKTPELAKEKGAYVKVNSLYRRVDLISIIRPYGLPW